MLTPVAITRLEKAATDNGFDLELEHTSDWLAFGSSQTSMRIWLTARGESRLLAAMSRPDVLKGLDDPSVVFTDLLPSGAVGAASVRDITTLHRLLRRAFQLSRTLPDALLHVFENETANLPRTTEVERLVVRRVGQDIFRRGLLEYWDGRCAITGLDVPDLLRASHIKPWADCDTDAERLDVFNGLLLAPHLDAAFDSGFITIAEDRTVVISDALSASARSALGLDGWLKVRGLHGTLTSVTCRGTGPGFSCNPTTRVYPSRSPPRAPIVDSESAGTVRECWASGLCLQTRDVHNRVRVYPAGRQS